MAQADERRATEAAAMLQRRLKEIEEQVRFEWSSGRAQSNSSLQMQSSGNAALAEANKRETALQTALADQAAKLAEKVP